MTEGPKRNDGGDPAVDLIQPNGLPRLGIFPAPVGRINYLDYDYRSPMGRRVGTLGKRMRWRQFQYFGGMSAELMFGCAIANMGYVALAFLYVFRPATRAIRRYSFRVPFARGVQSSLSPGSGTTALCARGVEIEMRADPATASKHLRARVDAGLAIDASFSEREPPFQPMALCTQAGISGWVYAQKAAGVPLTGHVRSELGEFDLAAIDAQAHHDYSAGFMRRETFWRWACFSGRAETGERIGVNLSCGVNETSVTENCCWVDGGLGKVDLMTFDFDRDDGAAPWTIRSFDGAIDLRFRPEECHAERTNAFLVATNFRHFLGRFDGTVRHHDRVLTVRDVCGLAEDHYAKW